jgi:thiol-disulfide isomerase/thioredoxin
MAKPIILYYYATWCHHCKNFQPEWEKLVRYSGELYETREYNYDGGYGTPLLNELHKIDGFPTIRLIKNGELYNYNEIRTFDAILDDLGIQIDTSQPFVDTPKVEYYCSESCQYCQQFELEWEKLVDYTKELNFKAIKYICSSDFEAVSKYGVYGYPTIKITKDGRTYDYRKKRDHYSILKELGESIYLTKDGGLCGDKPNDVDEITI